MKVEKRIDFGDGYLISVEVDEETIYLGVTNDGFETVQCDFNLDQNEFDKFLSVLNDAKKELKENLKKQNNQQV